MKSTHDRPRKRLLRYGVIVGLGAAVLALIAISPMNDSPQTPEPSTESASNDAALVELNACLARYRVQMYRGSDGRHRVWGDINRIQDIVDGQCRELFPDGAANEVHDFFSFEVDGKVAECLKKRGIAVKMDSSSGAGLEIDGPEADPDVIEDCFHEAYAFFASPPVE